MSSLFKSSKETGQNVHDKIFIYGPTHTGKTHAALSWPDCALIDVENRGAHFADRNDFFHAQPHSMTELVEALDELKAGRLAVKTCILDSYSVAFEKVKVRFTRVITKEGKPTAVIDNISINRAIAPVREFIFSISDQNLVVIAHAHQKYDVEGENRFRKRAQIEFLGDDKFRFAFDYILRAEPTGPDPRVQPVKFIVEKSASPQLAVGNVLLVKPNERLYEIFRSRVSSSSRGSPAQQSAPMSVAPGSLSGEAITTEQLDQISPLVQRAGLGQMELVNMVKRYTNGRTAQYQHMMAREARLLISELGARRSKGAA